MQVQPKVLIVGCGAVGTMAAFALQKSGIPQVTAVIRSNFNAVEAQGLHIVSIDHGTVDGWKPHIIKRSISDAAQCAPYDYVVVALKNIPEVHSVSSLIEPVVTPNHTTIVLIQNGIHIEQPILDSFPHNVLLSGVPMIGCNLNGREVLHNDPDVLQIAPYHNEKIDIEIQRLACRKFAEMYTLGGAKAIVHDDVTWQRWRKLLWNASFNTVCAITDIDSGAIQDLDALETLIRPAMRDIIAIARASGVALPDELEDEMVRFTPKEARLKPNMQVDASRKSPMEIETILENPLRVARNLGVEAKTLEVLYRILKVVQWKFLNLESFR